MSKRSLKDVVQQQTAKKRSGWDLASEVFDAPEKDREPQAAPSRQIPRTTARLSISLLDEEREALERISAELRAKGHRDLKTSRLARVAFRMLLDATEEDLLRVADQVPNLERLRGTRRSDNPTMG